MNAQEILNSWDHRTADETRREIYEVLMAVPEFAGFLTLLKEYQFAALRMAQSADRLEEMSRFHGSASAIDDLLEDIRERLADTSAEL